MILKDSNKMKWFVIILLLLCLNSQGQTVIQMLSPEDASVVLLEVKNKEEADIVVYKTKLLREAGEWDLKWKFRQWGFCNFSVFIAKDTTELYTSSFNADSDQEQIYVHYCGKVYFTEKKEETEYNKSFSLPGVMKVKRIKIVMNF